MPKKSAQPDDQSPERSSQSELAENNTPRRTLVFDVRFLEDLTYWVETNRKTALRLLSLIEEIGRTPFTGTGKPERLQYQDGNVWSRRLTDKDRVVYLIADERIEFCKVAITTAIARNPLHHDFCRLYSVNAIAPHPLKHKDAIAFSIVD